jgi:hypothetical protein
MNVNRGIWAWMNEMHPWLKNNIVFVWKWHSIHVGMEEIHVEMDRHGCHSFIHFQTTSI